MQRAQLGVRRQRVQQRARTLRVEKYGFAANFNARGQCFQWRVHQLKRARAIDLDHIGLQRVSDQLPGCAFSHFFAVVEHDQPVAQTLGFVHEMRRQQNRLALLHQPLQPLPHQVARLRVEPRRRFVKQQQLRVVDQRARQAQAALHAARELAEFGIGLGCQRGKLQQLRNALLDDRVFDAEVAAEHQQVFGAREVRVQAVELADDAKLRLDCQRVFRHVQRTACVAAAEVGDLARIRRSQPQAHADGGGFAGAVGADQPQALARCDVEGKIVDDGAVAVTLVQAVYAEKGRGHAAIVAEPACPLGPPIIPVSRKFS